MVDFQDGLDIDYPIKKEHKAKKPGKFTGFCFACNSSIDHGAFCDSWCKEDYEFEENIRKIMNRPKK